MKPSTDTVPAMLTPGEFVIRKDAAEEIGPEKLNMLNNIDRLGQSALLENTRSPMGYQEGGVISGMMGDTAEKYSDLKSLFGGKQRFSDLSDEAFEKTSDQLFDFIRGRRKMDELVAQNPELQGPSGMEIRKEDDKKLLEESLSKVKADYTPTEQAYLKSLPAQEKIARKYNILAEAGLPQKPQPRTNLLPDFSGLDTSMRKPQFVDPRDHTMRDRPYVGAEAGPTETMFSDVAMPNDWTNQFELPETVEDWGPTPEEPRVSWGDLSAYDKLGMMLMGEIKWDNLRGKSRRIMSGKESSAQGYDYEIPGAPTLRDVMGFQEGGEVAPTWGERVVAMFPSHHKDPEKAAEQQRGLASLVNFLTPQSLGEAGLMLAAGPVVGKAVKGGAKALPKLSKKAQEFLAKAMKAAPEENLPKMDRATQGMYKRALEKAEKTGETGGTIMSEGRFDPSVREKYRKMFQERRDILSGAQDFPQNPEQFMDEAFEGGMNLSEAFAKRKEIYGFQEGGPVMHNEGEGQMNEVLSLFGEKSQDADGLQKLAALATMQRALDIQKAIGAHGEGMATHTMPDGTVMPGATHQESGSMGMQAGGYIPQYQQGGPVKPPMSGGEEGPQQVPMSSGQQAYHKPPMEQLGMDPFEYDSYLRYGPEMYKYFAQKYKPKTEWTVYDSLVDSGQIDPYEVSKDSINVLTDDQLNELVDKSGIRQ